MFAAKIVMSESPFKWPVISGLAAGAITIIWLTGWYLANNSAIGSFWVQGLTWLFYIGAMSWTGMQAVQINNQFQPVLRAIFITFLVTNLLYYAYDLVLVRWIDPSIADYRKAETIRFYEGMGDAENVKEMLKQVQEADFVPTIGTTIFNYFRGAIGGFIIAFVMTFVFRRRFSMND